ncbi:MAG TPA: DUF3280 domain-containing protein [Steroidobacteraceae bacterium]|jgi:hypothetical protein|nr:DUF3280 domain-containing protein [Steroidobacteraceae bacterium]
MKATCLSSACKRLLLTVTALATATAVTALATMTSVTAPAAIALATVTTAAAAETAVPEAGAAPPAKSAPVKIAVFDFELDDASAAGAYKLANGAEDRSRMDAVTAEARRYLAQSGRYALVDTAAAGEPAVKTHELRRCDGCEAAIAAKLGADQSLVGVVTRVAQTEYYATVQIRNAKTGKVIEQQTAFFTGADDAWPSGVRLLLKHQVLAEPN